MAIHDPKLPKRPLNVMFVITSMPVGGAEVLLMNLVRRFDPQRIKPSICCLKEKDELGEEVSYDIPVFDHQIKHKFDLAVIKRLGVLYKKNKIDAIVTVGAGDKMFWPTELSEMPVESRGYVIQFCIAYLVMAAICFGMSTVTSKEEFIDTDEEFEAL